ALESEHGVVEIRTARLGAEQRPGHLVRGPGTKRPPEDGVGVRGRVRRDDPDRARAVREVAFDREVDCKTKTAQKRGMIGKEAEHLMEVDVRRSRRRWNQVCVRLGEIVVADLWTLEETLGSGEVLGWIGAGAAEVESPAVRGLQSRGTRLRESFRIRLA